MHAHRAQSPAHIKVYSVRKAYSEAQLIKNAQTKPEPFYYLACTSMSVHNS